ncbi:MAG: Spy/CpxP family protein refolding chaperone [Bosea sp. (in: a-proteobacteria)]|uniref:Spy/CpxP family protein refolding chaperone n=1 Tax=Bosea sp. (in: a-proteobacteria) TaxID=1871050 RepID=UPI003F7C233A
MKMSVLATVLIAFAGPSFAQAPTSLHQRHPGGAMTAQAQPAAPSKPEAMPGQYGMPMPMGQMMRGQGMPGRMMSEVMIGRFSSEDLSALMEAHIAAIHAGLKLSVDQEKLWPPVEAALRNLGTLRLSHMQAMRQTQGMAANDPLGVLRIMADNMSEAAQAVRKFADAAGPLDATFDEAQKRRLRVLLRMGSQGMMQPGMMRFGGFMMPDGYDGTDDGTANTR